MGTKRLVFFFILTLLFNALLFPQDIPDKGKDANIEEPKATPDNEKIQKDTAEDADAKKKDQYRSVSGLENWNYNFDISGYTKGIYNLIIKGTDKAGNIYYEGPFNIYIDPKSDLPVLNISNPNLGMRVGGNELNIVGTCVDDDGTDFVEVQVDDMPFTRAEGGEFWSFVLHTETMSDGLHTISARGTDINGLQSEPITVEFNLDRKKPLNVVTSHENGVLLSGNASLTGYSEDLNGIRKLLLSTDNGKTYETLKTTYNKSENKYMFKLTIATKKLEDGPHVYWFKSIDKTGSQGFAAFLFFVDNKNPELEILDPKLKPDEGEEIMKVNGVFPVSGKISDELGIKSLHYAYEKEEGDITLIPGNPYWIKEFDFTGAKGKNAAITFTAVDTTGNTLVKKIEFPLDREADLPVVNITFPIAETVIPGDVTVSGFVTDDDAVKEIRYSIDKGDPISRETTEAFSFKLDNLTPGKHNFTIWAIDIYGTEGKSVSVDFFNAGDSPLIALTKVMQNSNPIDFYPGIEIRRDSDSTLIGEMIISDKIENAEYTLKKGEPRKLVMKGIDPEGKKIFEIPLPEDIQFGVVDISLKIVDEYERTTEYTSFIYITNDTKINDKPGIYITDSRIDANGKIKISKDNPFSFLFVGEKIKSVAIEPETSIVKASNRDNLILVKSARDGVSEPVRIVITTIYDEVFTSQVLSFLNDDIPPVITVNSPGTGDWVRNEIEITGTLEDSSTITSLHYSTDNLKTFTDIPFSEEAGKIIFSGKAALSTLSDGNVSLFIRATDNAGNNTIKAISLNKDSTNPEISLLTPGTGDSIFTKKITLISRVKDNGILESVEISTDGTNYTKLSGDTLYKHTLNLSAMDALPEKIYIRGTDKSGNTNIISPPLSYNRSFLESGKLRSPGMDYKKDESYYKPGSMSLTLSGTDKAGTVSFKSSFTTGGGPESPPPRDDITPHDNNILVTGLLKMNGIIENSEEIAELFFSQDGGYNYEKTKVSYNKKDNTFTFSLSIKTNEIPDGPQVYWIKAVFTSGTAGQAPFVFTIDNTLPDITILSPGEDATLNGQVSVGGKTTDSIGIKSFSYSMGKESEEFTIDSGNPYWIKDFSFTDVKATSAQITFTAIDFTGNTNSKTLKLKLDSKTDMPVTGIVFPEPARLLNTDELFITGFAKDDERVKEIRLSIDGEEPRTIPGNEAFSTALSNISRGSHVAAIKAVDINGVVGPETKVEFVYAGLPPRTTIKNTLNGEATAAFEPGLLIQSPEGKTTLEGECSDNVEQAEYSMNGGELSKLTLKVDKATGIKSYSIPVGKELPFGKVDLLINISDKYSRKTTFTTFFYKVDVADAGTIVDNEGFFFVDSRLNTTGNIYLGKITPLQGLFNGRDIASIKLVPPQENVSVTNKGSLVIVKPVKDGISEQTQIQVETVNKRIFTSQKFRFYTDIEQPTVILNSPRTENWYNTTILFEGIARDNIGLQSLELSMDLGATFRSIKTEPGENGFTFSENISIKHLEDGPLTVILKASDESGNTLVETIALKKDTKKARVSLITPKPDDVVNGMVTIVGAVEDEGKVEEVEFSSDGENFTKVEGTHRFSYDIDFSSYEKLPEKFYFRATDKSANVTLFEPPFTIDFEADKPIVQIQIPEEGATLKNDFMISGMVFDDDRVAAIYYRIDGSDFIKLDGNNNFGIPISLEEITDNEHTIEIQAEDIGGLKGDIAQRKFQISKAEPVSMLLKPGLDVTVREEILLEGESSDANGIKAVYVSYDNGCTFNLAELIDSHVVDNKDEKLIDSPPAEKKEGEIAAEESTEDVIMETKAWKYPLDTRILQDGVHRLFIKAVDKTDTEGIYSTLLNLDNTPPAITLDAPWDGDKIADIMFLDGRASDNVFLNSLTLSISQINLAEGEIGKTVTHELPTYGVFTKNIDLAVFTPGWYNLRIDATDKADNTSYLSRNILIQEKQIVDKIDIIFPGSGEKLSGNFKIDGRVISEAPVSNVVILLNGEALEVLPLNEDGYYSLTITPDKLASGNYILEVQANVSAEKVIKSEKRAISYSHVGGWVTIDNYTTGDFITERPWLKGEAGYILPEPNPEDKEAVKLYKTMQKEFSISGVEISFDNGKTFKKVSGTRKWKYRLETQWMPNGDTRILVRANFGEGEKAIAKTILVVDNKPPIVTMLNPEEGSRFNDKIEVLGLASDENGLSDVSINLRKGDKSSYSLPGFIQGLYTEGTYGGLMTGNVGLGLTFFDQVVKFQALAGIAPPGKRFTGLVLGVKILANILSLPAEYFFGPDLAFLSLEMALGGSFTYYSNTEEITMDSNTYKFFGSFVSQLELKFRFKELSMFSTYSLFMEFAVALIASDVPDSNAAPALIPAFGFGVRIGIF
ncbi:MAG: hypothetical protein JXJ04_07950 [Spirochaetales bacterium]|nr:hypothetical protein [Spirochaetales bacterium]